MKKVTIFFICIIALSFSTNAQISISHRAEGVKQQEAILPYDSTKNFLGTKNVRSYIGQVLYVRERSENVRKYGYDHFKKEKEPDPFSKNGRYGRGARENSFNTKYEDLVGKYFVVKNVLPDSRQERDPSLYGNKWWFLLENQDNPSDFAWFEYNGNYEHSFPFITMCHYNYLQANIKGTEIIAPYKKEQDGSISSPYISDIDFNTGRKIEFSENDVWIAEGATVEDKEYKLVILAKNQKGETSVFNSNDLVNKGPIDGKMKVLTLNYYEELVSSYGVEYVEKARKSVVVVGMPEDCVVLAWGYPEKINKTSYGPQQWVYGHQYVYIENGIVTAWN